MIRRRTTNYPLVALCYLTFRHLRITRGLNLERGPRIVPADPLMACAAGHEERPVETDNVQSWPLLYGSMAPPLPFMYPTFGVALAPRLVSFTAVQGPEDMLSSLLGQPPRGFVIPLFAMYDGSSNPYNHMLHFNQAMIMSTGNDRLLFKVFLASLKGPALAWFHKLPR